MNIETLAGDYYEDVHFISMENGWLAFGDEDTTSVVPVSLVAEVNFTDADELERFRKAAAHAAVFRVTN